MDDSNRIRSIKTYDKNDRIFEMKLVIIIGWKCYSTRLLQKKSRFKGWEDYIRLGWKKNMEGKNQKKKLKRDPGLEEG